MDKQLREFRRKKKNQDYDPKDCEWCGEGFKPKREYQRFCDPKCRYAAWFDRTYVRREETQR
jgi:hypothetical protein